MKTTKKLLLMLVAAALLSPSFAADKKKEMDDSKAMMEKAMKQGAPSAAHDVFKALVGTFNANIKMWMAPNTPPQEAKGTSENVAIFDGRFVKQTYKSQFAGKSFEGMGFYGYDNLRGEYQTVWMDNMSTTIMKNTAGSYDATTKTITETGTFSCPMTGETARAFRSELKIVDSNTHTYTSYSAGPDGKMNKDMEITYTRSN